MPSLRPGLEPVAAEFLSRRPRVSWLNLLLLLLIAGWALYAGRLAAARQDGLQTNAFDLGYVSQTLWNTVHGRPFRFSTLIDAPFQVEGVNPSHIHHPAWLFAFHVEPALLLVAPLYALWQDPKLLLWLQVALIPLGAFPAAWLARKLFASDIAGLLFGLAYLLAPGLEGAALSDFHMVAIAPPALMLALFLIETGRLKSGVVVMGLVALCREDAALTVAWLGGLLVCQTWWRQRAFAARQEGTLTKPLRPRQERVSPTTHEATFLHWPLNPRPQPLEAQSWLLALFIASTTWTALCFFVIAPFFNGEGSVFWSRYSWLGAGPLPALGGVFAHPLTLLRWLAQPNVRAYLGVELLTGGVLALLAPFRLLAAAPLLAVNALSAFDWMRSGGGHYSALLVPLLIWAGMHGARRLVVILGGGVGWRWLAPLVCVAGVAAAQAWIGVNPVNTGFGPIPDDARAAQVLAGLPSIPADVPVSASSALYPHLSDRQAAYWFPGRTPSSWIALDVDGITHPLDAAQTHDVALGLLSDSKLELIAARAGLLVFRPAGETADRASLAYGGLAGQAPIRKADECAHGPDTSCPYSTGVASPVVLPSVFFTFVRVPAMPAAASPETIRFGS
ncbi:MAG: DUF2079 domain-containing protein, partial [Chloroflexota bacterium]|nr:DUF2079 domain-containing protein [Chloroflexota bacterium]